MDKIKNTSIQDIFNTMDYGESYEKVDEAIEWIKNKESSFFAYIENSSESANGTKVEIKNCINDEMLCTQYVPEITTINKILSKYTNNKVKWIDTNAFQRSSLLNKLAGEIEKSADVISQLEIVCRGILGKDTRSKAIPLLAQYFYYYSSFSVKYSHENPNWKPEGLAVGVISNENILSNLGLILAPALAAGYNVILQVGTALLPTVSFITELIQKVGIPEEVIRLIPSDCGNLQPYLNSENVSILTLFVDLNNEKYLGSNKLNKKILNLSSNKIPVIIFDDADLDSACTNIVESAWGYQGLLPWSVNTVIVQENIFDMFLNKLKTELGTTKVGLGNNKVVDISSTSETSFNKLKKLIKSAKNQGIEVFQTSENSNTFTPTLFVGGKVSTNKVLSAEEDQDANVVTVIAFRSIDEAVNLANNSRQGLAASVWTENVGTVNEVAKKLKVNNVWINSHGLTVPEITLSPIKDSGVGYFGGKEGFYEYVQVKKNPSLLNTSDATTKVSSSQASFINFAKKPQENWSRLSKLNKAKIFQKFAEYIESNKKELRVSSETSTQTTEFGVAEKGTSTQATISTEVQTMADDTDTVLKSTSEADMEKLANWLSKIYPRVKKEIDNANNSRAFRGYRLARDRSDANCKLLQTLNVFKSGDSGDKATKISSLTWNRTGKTIAVTCNYEHTSWCYHLGEVLIYTLNRDERLPDVPRTKLSTESCVMSLKFHPVHPAILAAGTFAGGIIIWNIQNDEGDDVVTTVSAHEEMVTQLSWITDINSSKSIILASSSTDGLLKLWTFNSANTTLTIKAKYKIKPPILGSVYRTTETPEHVERKVGRGVICFDFSKHVPDLFVVGIEGGLMVQCSVLGATPLKGSTKEEPLLDPAFKYYEPHEGEITSVSISPNRNDMFMTSGTDAEIRIYLFGQEEPAQVIFMRNPLSDLRFVPHEDKLVAGCGPNGVLEIFHLITGRAVENITKEKVNKQILSSLAVNCDKTSLIALGTVQGDLQLWNVPWQAFSRNTQ